MTDSDNPAVNFKSECILLDSSAWLSYFIFAEERVKKIIDSGNFILFTSSLSLHEVRKRLLGVGKEKNEIENALVFMKLNSIIVYPNESICEKSADDCLKQGFHTIDAIIYRSAVENESSLLTFDSDFKGKEKVIYFGK